MPLFLDFGFGELLVIGIVALIVVGPKELPVLFRSVGQFMGKARGMAREFSRAMNDAADDAGVKDIQKTIRTATNPVNSAMDGVKDAARSMMDLNPDSETGKLSKEREEARRKIQANAARAAADRKTREAEAAAAQAEAMEQALTQDAPAGTAPAQDPKDGDKPA